MKNLFIRTLSILCAVTMLICTVFACAFAEEQAATPTDLAETEKENSQEETSVLPATQPEEAEPEAEGEEENKTEGGNEEPQEADPEESEGTIESVEIIITRAMTLGESWEGVTGANRLVVLKLDINQAQTVHMIVEGKNTWANVQKSDRLEENLRKVLTDPETKRAIITWEAERGSYLITIGPEEPNLMSKAKVTFLDDEAYEAWEDALEETEEEPDEIESEQESEIESEQELEAEKTAWESKPFELPENRSVTFTVAWDGEKPAIRSIVHFKAELKGYDGLDYTLQWQMSRDAETWINVEGETGETMDLELTEDNCTLFWRVTVYIYIPQDN